MSVTPEGVFGGRDAGQILGVSSTTIGRTIKQLREMGRNDLVPRTGKEYGRATVGYAWKNVDEVHYWWVHACEALSHTPKPRPKKKEAIAPPSQPAYEPWLSALDTPVRLELERFWRLHTTIQILLNQGPINLETYLNKVVILGLMAVRKEMPESEALLRRLEDMASLVNTCEKLFQDLQHRDTEGLPTETEPTVKPSKKALLERIRE